MIFTKGTSQTNSTADRLKESMPTTQLGVSGVVNSNGSIAFGTENFAVEKTGTGTYRINYTPEFPGNGENGPAPGCTPIGSGSAVRMESVSKAGFTVKFTLLATLLLGDTAFSFQAVE